MTFIIMDERIKKRGKWERNNEAEEKTLRGIGKDMTMIKEMKWA